jgi:hypothetical protein
MRTIAASCSGIRRLAFSESRQFRRVAARNPGPRDRISDMIPGYRHAMKRNMSAAKDAEAKLLCIEQSP